MIDLCRPLARDSFDRLLLGGEAFDKLNFSIGGLNS
jgi:hypothetical protein